MVSPIKTAVVGAGQIARQHLACLRELRGVEIAAVCDLSQAKAQSVAERFGVPCFYTDYARMLQEVSPQVVHVTTSPQSHFQLALSALDAGASVFIEKPAVVAYEDLAVLTARAEEKGLMVVEDHNYLFNPLVRKVVAMKEAGDLGRISHVEILFCVGVLGPGSPFADRNVRHPALSLPGGVVYDFLPHMAYLALALSGPVTLADKLWLPAPADSLLPCEQFMATLRHDHGTVSLGFSANAQPNLFALRVYGEQCRVELNLLEPHLTVVRPRKGPPFWGTFVSGMSQAASLTKAAFLGLHQRIADTPGPYEGMWELIGRTYTAIEQGGPAPVSVEQIDATHRLMAELVEGAPRL